MVKGVRGDFHRREMERVSHVALGILGCCLLSVRLDFSEGRPGGCCYCCCVQASLKRER